MLAPPALPPPSPLQSSLSYCTATVTAAAFAVCLTSCLGCISPSNVRLLLCLNSFFLCSAALLLMVPFTKVWGQVELYAGGLSVDQYIWATAGAFCFAVLAYSVFFVFQRRKMFKQLVELEGELPHRLLDGTVRLLSSSWLHGHDWRLVRHQELPPSAFLSPVNAHAALRHSQVAALSYRRVLG